ncbi:MAG: hypothetical protein U9N55_00345 [candidate division Zixibacteria bacterium]|nr:hypothetical protein [candidate division Zixibacteria bacterium]
MKTIRIIVALLLTLTLLYVARENSRGRPEFYTHTENGYTFEFNTVPKITEHKSDRLSLKITGPFEPGIKAIFRQSLLEQDKNTNLAKYGTAPLSVEDSAAGIFYAQTTAGDKGGRTWYYFEIRDNVGGLRASLRMPNGEPFMLKYIGEVPSVALFFHILFMFATVFFAILGALYGFDLVRNRTNAHQFAMIFFITTVSAFLGCYPFGFMMNHYAFGTIWEGVPFGTDATDNKTQLLFVYLVFITLSSIGSLTRGKIGRNIFSLRTLGWFGIGSFFVLLGIYLIPHSIQFSPGLTKAVCWLWISHIAMLYLFGQYNTWRKSNSAGKHRKRTPLE